ncbi:MAG: hypothetical protein ABF904_05150 [Ethanoligenens sp.]
MEMKHTGAGSSAEQMFLATATDRETGAVFLLYLRQSAEIAIQSPKVPGRPLEKTRGTGLHTGKRLCPAGIGKGRGRQLHRRRRNGRHVYSDAPSFSAHF